MKTRIFITKLDIAGLRIRKKKEKRTKFFIFLLVLSKATYCFVLIFSHSVQLLNTEHCTVGPDSTKEDRSGSTTQICLSVQFTRCAAAALAYILLL